MKTNETTAKIVSVRVRSVGQAFGCVGQVVAARNHRVMAETAVMPSGMEGAALDAAERLAAERGYRIATEWPTEWDA